MDFSLEGETALLLLIIAVSAFFSAAEVAFVSISNVKAHALLEHDGIGAESLHRLKHNNRRTLIMLLIWSGGADVAASALATSMAIGIFGSGGLGVAIGVMTFILLAFEEIIPKSAAVKYSTPLILWVSPLLEALYYVSLPLVFVFEQLIKMIPGLDADQDPMDRITVDEVRAAVKVSLQQNDISKRQHEIIEKALAFDKWPVERAMTPKSRVHWLSADDQVAEAHRKALANFHIRYPVMRKGRVVGVVRIEMIGKALYEHPEWTVMQLSKPPFCVKVGENASSALTRMQLMERHLAIVKDPHGKFEGIVTTHDLVEKLVGEII